MSHRLISVAVAVVVALGGVTTAATAHGQARVKPPTASDVAARVQRLYDETKSYQARFRQIFRMKVQNVKRVNTGMVRWMKPGKISFRYDEPSGNRVVSDGNTIKIFERNNKQMYLAKVSGSQYPAALSFLMGQGRLARDFKLRLLDPKRLKVKRGFVLEGIPKDRTAAYDRLLIYVSSDSYHVRRVLVLDAHGNRNRFDFQLPRLNVKIPDKEFSFKPPADTTIIRP